MNQDELKDFYAHALAIIDESLSNVINDVSQSASASVLSFATPVLILVVMMYGFKIARGGAHYADAAWKIVFWVAVYILGTSTAIYQENIAEFFFSWPDWLANSLVTNGQEANKLTGFIDQVFAGYMTVSLRFRNLARHPLLRLLILSSIMSLRSSWQGQGCWFARTQWVCW